MSKKLWIEQYGAVEYSETHSENGNTWEDKTNDAITWDLYGERVLDYWFVIGKIKNLLFLTVNPNYPILDESGWGNLTPEQKKVWAKLPYCSPTKRRTIYSIEEDYQNGINLIRKTYGLSDTGRTKGRLGVVERMRTHVYMKYVWEWQMSLDTSIKFGEDTYQFLGTFEMFSSRKFYQWLTNEVGSAYELNGFMQQNYLPTTQLMEQLKNELLIIFNGE